MYLKTDSLGHHEIVDGDDDPKYNKILAKLITLRNMAASGDLEAMKALDNLASIAEQGNPTMLRLIKDMNQRAPL
jgi:hypothetical protein